MKKHQMVAAVGTLALVANLLVPGLAFGQGTGAQTASQTINCTATGVLALDDTPDNMTFDTLTASPSTQNSFDSDVLDGAVLPDFGAYLDDSHLMVVRDTRSGGVAGCPVTTPGFSVTAEITTTLTTGSTTIPDSAFRIITANTFGGSIPLCAAFTATPSENEVCYGIGGGGSTPGVAGNLRDILAPVLYDDSARDPDIAYDAFRTAAIYANKIVGADTETTPTGPALTNTLDAPVTLLTTSTGHNLGAIVTDTVLYGLIPAGQGPGVYTGTVTYTLAAV